MNTTKHSTKLQAAESYFARGWLPIRVNGKKPIGDAWQRQRPSLGDVREWFDHHYGPNLGILNGEPSGWLVDVDLDHAFAVELGDQFLPETQAEFGRTGKPRSHRLYIAVGAETLQREVERNLGGMLVELRSTGSQTVFPPSRHVDTKEPIEWVTEGEPTVIDAAFLTACVNALADEVEHRLDIKPKPEAPKVSHRNGSSHVTAVDEVEQAVDALESIPPSYADCYSSWVRVGMSLRSVSDSLLDEWDAWSQSSSKYREGETAKKWETFGADGGIGPGTLYHLAKANGWQPKRHKRNGNEHAAVSRLVDNAEQVENPFANARPRITFERITAAELDSGDYHTEYLIDGTMTAGQPMIVAGGKKQLKTNVLLDAAISLATGGSFLGMLKATRAARVGIMSGESGMATIQETCLRICKSKGVELQDIEGLIFSSDLPRLDDVRYLVALEEFITNDEIEVAIFDPAYLMMPGGDASNLFIQGEMLRNLSQRCDQLGATMILCHHTKKGVTDPFSPPELEDIAWAGFQEFARQWWLIGRREKYEPGTGKHALWFNIGGSAGHSSLWGVNINEGIYRGPGTREWDVELLTAEEAREESISKVQDDKQANKGRQRAAEVKACKEAILNAFNGLPDHRETLNRIKERAGKGVTFDAAFGELIREGQVNPAKVTRDNGQTYDGYERVYPVK